MLPAIPRCHSAVSEWRGMPDSSGVLALLPASKTFSAPYDSATVCTLLELYASTSTRVQRASRAPCLHAFTPPHHNTPPRVLCLHASMSLNLQRAVPRYACIEPSDLRASTSTHTQRDSSTPYLPTSTSTRLSVPLRRYTCIELSELRASTSTHAQRDSGTPYLHTSTSTRLQRISSAPYLHTFTPTRVQPDSTSSVRYFDTSKSARL